MSSLWGTQPPLCRYSPLSTSPRQHTTPGHLLHTTDSSSPLQLLLLLLSLSPQSKVHPCLCTSQVLGSWLPSLWGHWELGGGRPQVAHVSLTMFPALLLYCIVLSSLYYRVLLSYCIVYYSQSHSIPILTSLRGQLHTNKQLTLLTLLYCIILLMYH